MKVTKQIFFVAMIALAAFACKNTKYKKTKEGFPYKIYSSGKGDLIKAGNVVRYHITNKFGDSTLMTTYGQPARWLLLPKEGELNGLAKLLIEARQGDSILVIQPIDTLIAQAQRQPQPYVDSFLLKNRGKEVRLYINITDVFKDDAAAREVFDKENIDSYFKNPEIAQQKPKDVATIDAHLKANNISTKLSPWGVYVQTITPGSGPKPKYGDFVTVNYKGRLLTGEQFDAGTYPLQIGAGGSILGFEDGIKQLSKGEKAVLYIPSVVGYGKQGNPPKIAPDQKSYFEIEVVNISDKPSAPPTVIPDSTGK